MGQDQLRIRRQGKFFIATIYYANTVEYILPTPVHMVKIWKPDFDSVE